MLRVGVASPSRRCVGGLALREDHDDFRRFLELPDDLKFVKAESKDSREFLPICGQIFPILIPDTTSVGDHCVPFESRPELLVRVHFEGAIRGPLRDRGGRRLHLPE